MGPIILPLMDELDFLEEADSFLDWAYKFIKKLEADHFTTLLRHDVNKIADQ